MNELWRKGDPLAARRLNRMQAALQTTRLEESWRESHGTVPNGVPIAVTVVSVHEDYLVCRPLGITTDVADIFVAKPWDLRKTPFHSGTLPNKDGTPLFYAYTSEDGQARTVTDTTDDSTEDQVIVPAYVPAQTLDEEAEYPGDYTGSQITVQRVANGTGVTFTAADTGYIIEVEWEDMNRAGRAWAEDNGS